jgi:hypothetical protein
MTTADRAIAIPSPYMGGIDAVLTLETPDGERGDMELSVAGQIVARGEDFHAPQVGPSLLEQSDESLVALFGAFLSHAFESSEDDARDGWPILADAASDWTDALAMFGESV